VVEAIIGYRMWRLKPDDGTVWLQSIYVDSCLWPQLDPLRAECRCGTPGLAHTCGIYAWEVPLRDPYPGIAVGEVALWGEVHTHTLGYRAEFARPVSINGAPGLLSRVAAYQYDIPTVKRA